MRDWKQTTFTLILLALSTSIHWNIVICHADEVALTPPSLESEHAVTSEHSILPTQWTIAMAELPLKAEQLETTPEEVEKPSPPQMQMIAELNKVPDATVMVAPLEPNTSYVLRTVYNKQLQEAGFYINNQEIFRFRSKLGFLTPYLRSKQVQNRLQEYAKEGLRYQDVHLKRQAEGDYNLMMGKNVLTIIDENTARSAHMPLDNLAKLWLKQLRMALGEKPVLEDVASNLKASGRFIAKGVASWYGPGFHGRRAADGSRFNMYAMTAAHKSLPFGTRVRVTNEHNGKSCVVKITDRGPYSHNRVIDLSKAAATAIGSVSSGVAKVKLEVLH
jgi:rare lipoprotein A (peptidoglycan hydrolase)